MKIEINLYPDLNLGHTPETTPHLAPFLKTWSGSIWARLWIPKFFVLWLMDFPTLFRGRDHLFNCKLFKLFFVCFNLQKFIVFIWSGSSSYKIYGIACTISDN